MLCTRSAFGHAGGATVEDQALPGRNSSAAGCRHTAAGLGGWYQAEAVATVATRTSLHLLRVLQVVTTPLRTGNIGNKGNNREWSPRHFLDPRSEIGEW